MANLRTAVMLFVVTVVFVITFLPAFLMALRLVPYNIVVFYFYFANNVANPFIYSFMNQVHSRRTRTPAAVHCVLTTRAVVHIILLTVTVTFSWKSLRFSLDTIIIRLIEESQLSLSHRRTRT